MRVYPNFDINQNHDPRYVFEFTIRFSWIPTRNRDARYVLSLQFVVQSFMFLVSRPTLVLLDWPAGLTGRRRERWKAEFASHIHQISTSVGNRSKLVDSCVGCARARIFDFCAINRFCFLAESVSPGVFMQKASVSEPNLTPRTIGHGCLRVPNLRFLMLFEPLVGGQDLRES